ncbi:CRISPR-associated endoribonuclease Cas6 [Anabaena cylindrica FACHB-243]|uniref:CRISPR-associated protein, Cas6 family n=1 Tax=Anabaena cylindrica (strain ATCC 27899 / PCC 7122) TaxID=272123 RepID=K9ZK40_ANACC|nr:MULTISPECIES: CRISPR-associated endoribonuclease Cas6 [Anabaena]AFZ59576.1 CRISPR-associated protein, Cas6 family [Anabaena cylindrica PCC 7122]MBD2418759.1 CRISPR-associated endoribonuclease Cas6 [Anabaena cylindrica FACHB-243]MBY5282434.1 CRISPR-associated endoribonuclease Cas6 [Anabaena sp. CCAP 1446/1C]MBY5310832.1 CRISPR-associated endoribonuclease Cas6 [Anabaena sp. CCAP 1446/1C]MCM2406323.1 CRISPR-associated endoribonuclease Cas6 [Anabaena sp. CCAP 1446/1C]
MPRAATSSKRKTPSKNTSLVWADNTELVGLVFDLEATNSTSLYSQYTIGLHAWFLDQVRQINPDLSAYLHDSESEKPFNISALAGQLLPTGKQLQLQANQTLTWQINAISQPVVQFLSQWLTQLPPTLQLRDVHLQIKQVSIIHPPTTYSQLLQSSTKKHTNINLSFISPTSFRRKGHHFPLPVPVNLFHSYLRRWNDFSGIPVEQDAFLNWIDENVIIHQHRLESVKVAAGKRGSVTGFTGAISLGLSKSALANIEFTQLFYTLVQLAPYCGTGHKTTFGLGQTCLDWVEPKSNASSGTLTTLLGERIEELTAIFTAQRKRTGGDSEALRRNRTEKIAITWATILARREMGESLQVIAKDLEIPYITVKTYVKLARRALKDTQ